MKICKKCLQLLDEKQTQCEHCGSYDYDFLDTTRKDILTAHLQHNRTPIWQMVYVYFAASALYLIIIMNALMNAIGNALYFSLIAFSAASTMFWAHDYQVAKRMTKRLRCIDYGTKTAARPLHRRFWAQAMLVYVLAIGLLFL